MPRVRQVRSVSGPTVLHYSHGGVVAPYNRTYVECADLFLVRASSFFLDKWQAQLAPPLVQTSLAIRQGAHVIEREQTEPVESSSHRLLDALSLIPGGAAGQVSQPLGGQKCRRGRSEFFSHQFHACLRAPTASHGRRRVQRQACLCPLFRESKGVATATRLDQSSSSSSSASSSLQAPREAQQKSRRCR